MLLINENWKTAMNKSSKQESNILKATFEKEYGVSTEEVYKVASQVLLLQVRLFVSLDFYIK